MGSGWKQNGKSILLRKTKKKKKKDKTQRIFFFLVIYIYLFYPSAISPAALSGDYIFGVYEY